MLTSLFSVATSPQLIQRQPQCVYSPKVLDSTTSGVPSAPAHHMLSITLSNRSHALLVMVLNASRERIANVTVHPAQRGFMPGRTMLSNIYEAIAPMHMARLVEDTVPAVVLFDTRAAFPRVSWEWIWMVMHRLGVPAWLVTALQPLCCGSRSDIIFGGPAAGHGLPIRRGVL